MASKAKRDAAPRGRRKKATVPASRGLTPAQVDAGEGPAAVRDLVTRIRDAGGRALGSYRDPLGGGWQVLAVLPLEAVGPTPYQRDLSDAHVARLAEVLDGMDRFVDPVVAVPAPAAGFWTPNGNHRLAAMRSLGARSIVALVIPDPRVAFRILALNTEKAHNVREKALEVIRMARELARLDPRPEREFAVEFEEPAFLTLGVAYEQRPRFSGGAYQPVLRRVERFLAQALPRALETRAARAERLLVLDDAVVAAVADLKARGFESPYLKAFVLARVNPLRFQRGGSPEFDATIDAMLQRAMRFDAARVRADQVAQAAGPPEA